MAETVLPYVWSGLVPTGSAVRAMPPADVGEATVFKRRRLDRPPAPHPERLVPDVAATPTEAALWRRPDFRRRMS
jgi:hypothetical protein